MQRTPSQTAMLHIPTARAARRTSWRVGGYVCSCEMGADLDNWWGGMFEGRFPKCLEFSMVETHYSGDSSGLSLASSARVEEKEGLQWPVEARKSQPPGRHTLNPDLVLVGATITSYYDD
jgi:hypothetical protein